MEIRVLACLVEKQRTTPDAYPLSLNALRLACNQSTNRDPVVDYDEAAIRDALAKLSRRGWVRLASGAGSRAAKYRHLLDDALGLSSEELGLLAVLMLRGPQTPGELKQRSERLHPFASLDDVDSALARLAERELAQSLPRAPGRRRRATSSCSAQAQTHPRRNPTPPRAIASAGSRSAWLASRRSSPSCSRRSSGPLEARRNWRAAGDAHDQAGRRTHASCRPEACATREGDDPAPCRVRHPARVNFASRL